MAQGIKERFDSPEEEQRLAGENVAANLRVAIPGIIKSFDPATQTATVQPAISENVRQGQDDAKPTNLPLLTDVPCIFPRAGGYCLTFPVKEGDECLLVFSDMCIDGWWQSGGVQGQMETRRHDLSDASAILGITSVPRAVKGYSANSVVLRNEDNDSLFEIVDKTKTINITGAENINVTAVSDITVTTDGNITVKAKGNIDATADGTFNAKSTGAMTLESAASISLKAPTLNIEANISHTGNMATSGKHTDSVGGHV